MMMIPIPHSMFLLAELYNMDLIQRLHFVLNPSKESEHYEI